MRNGDLSNEVVPKILLVFEGALGMILQSDRRKFDRYIAKGRWQEAVALWHINPKMALKIWDVTRRLSMNLEIVTFQGPVEFGRELEIRLQDEEDLPVSRVWATTVTLLSRKIAYMPDLMRIYDPNPERQLTWGGKGQIITTEDQLGS